VGTDGHLPGDVEPTAHFHLMPTQEWWGFTSTLTCLHSEVLH
jgi:diadenosine tetraphosphate (Ap4A) HIT family hydrolase